MDKHKLGVIVPFRNRYEHLDIFIKRIKEYLNKNNIPHEIIIVEQDNAKQFNRGMLLNIGFKYAKKNGCKYVVFHDVDMIPLNVDYNFSDYPLHLATNFNTKREIFDEYFGGVTLFPNYSFELVNGYSNKYWDWGYEDTDLLHRCRKSGVELDVMKIKNTIIESKSLKFNGVDSFVKGRNVFDIENDLTFFISFYPDDILCDHTKDVDEYTIFSIPGYDTSISYNSFSRYNFLTFNQDKESTYLNTEIKTNYHTNITVTVDSKNRLISFYQDGNLIQTKTYKKTLLNYNYERYFYLGVGNPDRLGDERFFKGNFTTFVSYSKVLTKSEITNLTKGIVGKENLLIHYDANHVDDYMLTDLSGNKNNGKIHNCEIIDLKNEKVKKIKIPFRRKSVFELLPHEDDGFKDNKWKNKATRWNQLRFHNEVYMNDELLNNDGLSSLQFVEHGIEKISNNVIKLIVGV
jgi:hypothetical protein